MIYLDTSALVAYYLPEQASNAVQAILQANPVPVISELVQLELYSALAIRVRTQTLSQEDARRVVTTFENHLRDGYYLKIPVTAEHFQKAREFVGTFTFALKGAGRLAPRGGARRKLHPCDGGRAACDERSKVGGGGATRPVGHGFVKLLRFL